MVRVIFKINVDMDFINDYGSYIGRFSEAKPEEEWLLTYGGRYYITEDMYPAYFKNDQLIKKIENDDFNQ